AALFGEAPSRIVVSCAPAARLRLQDLASEHGVPVVVLGTVGGGDLIVRDAQAQTLLAVAMAEAHRRWHEGVAGYFEHPPVA
ncbi:MAG: hypothetical protein ACE5KY_07260, partial [Candidatus Tectimicrobiota bacterium]